MNSVWMLHSADLQILALNDHAPTEICDVCVCVCGVCVCVCVCVCM